MTVTIRKSVRLNAFLALLGTASMVSPALGFEGLTFEHRDWYLACDNTGTCRAAGYAPPGQGYAMAIMFSRQAGSATDINAKLFLGLYDEEPPQSALALYIDGQDLGPVSIDKDNQLTPMQVQALLAVVTTDAVIEIGVGQRRWGISGSGASAVFRKMDDYQGRSNTPFAVVAKGARAESQVFPALAPPTIQVHAPKVDGVTLEAGTAAYAEVMQLLQTHVPASELDFELDSASLETADLGEGKRFIGACWFMAYNVLCNHWLMDKNSPNMLTSLVSDGFYVDGLARQDRKARGYGDCWENEAWAFDGQSMVPTLISSTGPCKGIAGGIDPMPTYVTEVERL